MGYRYCVREEVDAYLFSCEQLPPQAVWFSVLASVLVPLRRASGKLRRPSCGGFLRGLFGLALLLGLRLSLEPIGRSYRSWA